MDPDPHVTRHADSDPPGPAAPGPDSPGPAAPGAGARPRRDRRRHLLAAIAAAWAVLLVVAAVVSVRRDAPTVREQRNLAQAVPVVDRATEDLITAAGPDVVVELAGRRVKEGCRLTLLRSGGDLESRIVLRTSAADGAGLLERIADRLPASYRAGTWQGSRDAAPRLRADAGEFVVVKGTVTDPGVVEITLRTGCRPLPDDLDVEVDLLLGRPVDEEPTRVLAALGATATEPVERVSAACAKGGAIRTARAVGTVPGEPSLAEALPAPAGAVVVAERPERYAWRHGPLNLVVEALDGEVRVAATTVC